MFPVTQPTLSARQGGAQGEIILDCSVFRAVYRNTKLNAIYQRGGRLLASRREGIRCET